MKLWSKVFLENELRSITELSMTALTEEGTVSDEEFLAAFEGCTLPEADWSHRAHVRMAWLYLRRRSFEQVLPLVRQRIMQYNATFQKHTGYHETITRVFLHLIHRRTERRQARTFEDFCEQNPDLFQGVPLLLKHYRKETLFSPAAREDFVSPDLEPLP